MMNRSTAQFRLAALWVVFAVILGLILFSQSLFGQIYSEAQADRIWEWLGEAILPTATVMLGVVGATVFAQDVPEVPTKLYKIAWFTSLVYLLAVAAVLALVGLRFSLTPLDMSETALKYFYAIANIMIGVFFVNPRGDR